MSRETQSEGLPRGWAETTLEDIARDVTYGYTAKSNRTSGGAKMLRITDIQDNRVDWSQVPFCAISAADKAKYLLKKWDLVFARTGATVGKSFLIRDDVSDSVFASYLIRVRCWDQEMTRYLSFFFNSPNYWDQITDFSAGIGQPNVNGTKLKGLVIPLAPLPEQKRIANKLDALLGRVDACRARLDRVPALLKRFRQSVLAAATSGKLTEEWRMTNGVNDEWEESRVQDVAEQVFDGPFGSHLKTADYTPSGVRVARLENIGWMTFLAEKEAFISPAKYKTLTRHTLKKDDVVFSSFISEETRVALLPESWSGKAINKSDCYCVRVDQKRCLPKFLMFRLACRSTYHILGEDVHGATRPRINLGQLKGFSFALPTLHEQQEIVRRVEALFALADRIEARLATAQKTVERLTPATLAKAFRGELVPQDSNDEPAAILLERITTEQSARASSGTIKHTTATGRQSRSISPNVIMNDKQEPLSVVAALESVGTSLSTSQLLHACGVPGDADSRTIESFLIEIRDALSSGIIGRDRIEEEDHFQLLKQ